MTTNYGRIAALNKPIYDRMEKLAKGEAFTVHLSEAHGCLSNLYQHGRRHFGHYYGVHIDRRSGTVTIRRRV